MSCRPSILSHTVLGLCEWGDRRPWLIPVISRIAKLDTNVATLTRTDHHGLPLRIFHRDYVVVSFVAIRLTQQFVIALQRQVDIANVSKNIDNGRTSRENRAQSGISMLYRFLWTNSLAIL